MRLVTLARWVDFVSRLGRLGRLVVGMALGPGGATKSAGENPNYWTVDLEEALQRIYGTVPGGSLKSWLRMSRIVLIGAKGRMNSFEMA
jgi:hypothetical protein